MMKIRAFFVAGLLSCSLVGFAGDKASEKQGSTAVFQVSDVVSNAQFSPEYKEYLCNEDMSYYLQNGGCRIIKLKDGRMLLVTIGRAACRGDTPDDRMRQEAIAEMNGLAEAVKYMNTTTMTSVQNIDSARIVTENGKEKSETSSEFSAIVRMKAQGMLKGMAKAGTWLSRDGQFFFLAKASFLTGN